MADRNDDQWLDALAGREAKDMNQATLEEIRSIRQALLEVAEKDQEDAVSGEHAFQRLLFRMRRDGLLQASDRRGWWQRLTGHEAVSADATVSVRTPSAWRRFGIPLSAAATLVLGTTVVMHSMQHPTESSNGLPPEFQMRGDEHVQVLAVKDVNRVVQQLKDWFDQSGIAYQVYPLGLKVGFEAQLPVPIPTELSNKLKQLGITVPQDGKLSLELQSAD